VAVGLEVNGEGLELATGKGDKFRGSNALFQRVPPLKLDFSEKKGNAEKKLLAAQNAFESGDTQLSARIHDMAITSKEKYKKNRNHYKSFIHGGLNGVITVFAVLAGVAGAGLGNMVVLVMGFAALFAEGVAMGVGDFFSTQAEIDYAKAEQKREEWEYDNYPKGEIEEMVLIYQKKGLQIKEAEELVETLTKNKNNFIDTMMVEELGILPPGETNSTVKNSLIRCASFLIFGSVPLIPFIIGTALGPSDLVPSPTASFWVCFVVATILSIAIQFGLGAGTNRFTILSWWKGGLYAVLLGCVGACVAFVVGWIVIVILGVSEKIDL